MKDHDPFTGDHKDNMRHLICVTPRRGSPGRTVWGLVLCCGHYVERASKPPPEPDRQEPRSRCDDCKAGSPPISIGVSVTPCTTCSHGPTGYGKKGCAACYGYGYVEKHIPVPDLLTGPGPGRAPGDHILGVWMVNLEGDLLTTVIAKRGRQYIGEHTRAMAGGPPPSMNMAQLEASPATTIEHSGDVMVVRDRFFPTSANSQDHTLEDAEKKFMQGFLQPGNEYGMFKRVFYEARTTNLKKVMEMEQCFTNMLMEGG